MNWVHKILAVTGLFTLLTFGIPSRTASAADVLLNGGLEDSVGPAGLELTQSIGGGARSGRLQRQRHRRCSRLCGVAQWRPAVERSRGCDSPDDVTQEDYDAWRAALRKLQRRRPGQRRGARRFANLPDADNRDSSDCSSSRKRATTASTEDQNRPVNVDLDADVSLCERPRDERTRSRATAIISWPRQITLSSCMTTPRTVRWSRRRKLTSRWNSSTRATRC